MPSRARRRPNVTGDASLAGGVLNTEFVESWFQRQMFFRVDIR
jgi:hypothetical protein